MSVSRMTRKRCAPSTCVPGNSARTLRRMMSSRNTKVVPGDAIRPVGSGTSRGSMPGTFTRANLMRPPWRTRTARFMLRFEMNGNGWPGSKASGVRTGKTWVSKYSVSQASIAGV